MNFNKMNDISPGHISVRPQFQQLVQFADKTKLLHKFVDDLSYPACMEEVRVYLFRIGK